MKERNDVQEKLDVQKKFIASIDPTALPKDHFDYFAKEVLKRIDNEIKKAKKNGLDSLKSFDKLHAKTQQKAQFSKYYEKIEKLKKLKPHQDIEFLELDIDEGL